MEKFKNEKRNRRLMLIGIILFFTVAVMCSCKKKKVEPECPEPVPTTTTTTTGGQPTCTTKLARFAGAYVFTSNLNDTVFIKFVRNNCPVEYSNTYEVKGLGKALFPYTNTGDAFGDSLLTFKSEEINKVAYHSPEKVSLVYDSLNPSFYKVVSVRLKNYSTTTYKLYKIK